MSTTAVQYFQPDLARRQQILDARRQRLRETAQNQNLSQSTPETRTVEEKGKYYTGRTVSIRKIGKQRFEEYAKDPLNEVDRSSGRIRLYREYIKRKVTYENGQKVFEVENVVVGKGRDKSVQPKVYSDYRTDERRIRSFSSKGEYQGTKTEDISTGKVLRRTQGPTATDTPQAVEREAKRIQKQAALELTQAKEQARNERLEREFAKRRAVARNFAVIQQTRTLQKARQVGKIQSEYKDAAIAQRTKKESQRIRDQTPSALEKAGSSLWEGAKTSFSAAKEKRDFLNKAVSLKTRIVLDPVINTLEKAGSSLWEGAKTSFSAAKEKRDFLNKAVSLKTRIVLDPVINTLEKSRNLSEQGKLPYFLSPGGLPGTSIYGREARTYSLGVQAEIVKNIRDRPLDVAATYALGYVGGATTQSLSLAGYGTQVRNVGIFFTGVFAAGRSAQLFTQNNPETPLGVGKPSARKFEKVSADVITDIGALYAGSQTFKARAASKQAQQENRIIQEVDTAQRSGKYVVREKADINRVDITREFRGTRSTTQRKDVQLENALKIAGKEFSLQGRSTFKGRVITRTYTSVKNPDVRFVMRDLGKGRTQVSLFQGDKVLQKSILSTPKPLPRTSEISSKQTRTIVAEVFDPKKNIAQATYLTKYQANVRASSPYARTTGVVKAVRAQSVESFYGDTLKTQYGIIFDNGGRTLKITSSMNWPRNQPQFSADFGTPPKVSAVQTVTKGGVKTTKIYQGGMSRDPSRIIIESVRDTGLSREMTTIPRVSSVKNYPLRQVSSFQTSEVAQPTPLQKASSEFTKTLSAIGRSRQAQLFGGLQSEQLTQKITLPKSNFADITPRLRGPDTTSLMKAIPTTSFYAGVTGLLDVSRAQIPAQIPATREYPAFDQKKTPAFDQYREVIQAQRLQQVQQRTQQTQRIQSLQLKQSLRVRSPGIPTTLTPPVVPFPPPLSPPLYFDIPLPDILPKTRRRKKNFKKRTEYQPTLYSAFFGRQEKLSKRRKRLEQVTGLTLRPLAR